MGIKYSRTKVLRVFRDYEEWSLEHVKAVYQQYRTLLATASDDGSLKLAMDRRDFAKVFSHLNSKHCTLQFNKFDVKSRGKVTAMDVFGGISLLCQDSIDARVAFCINMVDFDNSGLINQAELTMLMCSCLRGMARMKGLDDLPQGILSASAHDAFAAEGVHHRAGEGCGDFAEGGISIRQLVSWVKKDIKCLALLDNLDQSHYIAGLLERQRQLLSEMLDVEDEIAARKEQKESAAALIKKRRERAAAIQREKEIKEKEKIEEELRAMMLRNGIDTDETSFDEDVNLESEAAVAAAERARMQADLQAAMEAEISDEEDLDDDEQEKEMENIKLLVKTATCMYGERLFGKENQWGNWREMDEFANDNDDSDDEVEFDASESGDDEDEEKGAEEGQTMDQIVQAGLDHKDINDRGSYWIAGESIQEALFACGELIFEDAIEDVLKEMAPPLPPTSYLPVIEGIETKVAQYINNKDDGLPADRTHELHPELQKYWQWDGETGYVLRVAANDIVHWLANHRRYRRKLLQRRKTDLYATWSYHLLRLQLRARALNHFLVTKTSRWQKKSLWRRHMGESTGGTTSDEESDEENALTPQQLALRERSRVEALVSEKSGRNMTYKHKYVFEASDVGAFPAATLQVTSQKWKHPFHTALSTFTDIQRETGAAGAFVYIDLSLRDDMHERDMEALLDKVVEVFESVAFEHFTSDFISQPTARLVELKSKGETKTALRLAATLTDDLDVLNYITRFSGLPGLELLKDIWVRMEFNMTFTEAVRCTAKYSNFSKYVWATEEEREKEREREKAERAKELEEMEGKESKGTDQRKVTLTAEEEDSKMFLSQYGREILRMIFDKFDSNGDGTLSFGEMNALQLSIGADPFTTELNFVESMQEDGFDLERRGWLPPQYDALTGEMLTGEMPRYVLTFNGFCDAYQRGGDDLFTDIVKTGVGSLSYFLATRVTILVEYMSSLWTAMDASLETSRWNDTFEKVFAFWGGYGKEANVRFTYESLSQLWKALFDRPKQHRATVSTTDNCVDPNLCFANGDEVPPAIGLPGGFAVAIFNLRDMILKGMNMWRAKHGIAPLAPGQGRQEVGHGELSDWETSDEEGEGDNGGKMRVRPLKEIIFSQPLPQLRSPLSGGGDDDVDEKEELDLSKLQTERALIELHELSRHVLKGVVGGGLGNGTMVVRIRLEGFDVFRPILEINPEAEW